ncbi:hypothetical protein FV222_01560 [Methylobacterium sp. WL103]|uniref:hypothetical protein n=1 Tax=Methylobacterium sp. WL103 TaxID=2603891 RepID=UPI0011CAAD5A|nr:hypothetical protein [Methylobacterium sp. WL103]TXN07949.1 hypothetical protein FV222_01560 [Methylobacterium sp. WL103]
MTDLSLAPGCYGFALSFKAGSPECSTCPFAGQCEITGAEQLARRRLELGITVREKRVRKPVAETEVAVAAIGQVLTDTLPKKVDELIQRIEKAGIRVTEALREGRNPFLNEKPAFLRVACHLILHMPQGIDRKTLSIAFQKKLNWSEGTAAAHATQAFQALSHLGAAHEANGRLTLSRN